VAGGNILPVFPPDQQASRVRATDAYGAESAPCYQRISRIPASAEPYSLGEGFQLDEDSELTLLIVGVTVMRILEAHSGANHQGTGGGSTRQDLISRTPDKLSPHLSELNFAHRHLKSSKKK